MNRNQYKNPVNSGYISTRHNIVVARNTTFEEVSSKLNEHLPVTLNGKDLEGVDSFINLVARVVELQIT